MANKWGNSRNSVRLYFLASKITADGDCSHEIKRCLLFGRKIMTNLDNILKSRNLTLPTKICLVRANGFSSSHVWMWELDYKESWVQKNWYFWTVVLEKTLESPLDCKEIQRVHPKGHKSCVFIGRTDLKLKLQYFGHLMRRADSFEKTVMLGKTEGRTRRGRQRKRWLDDQLNGHEFGWTPGVGDGQGSLACCGSWGCKELNTTERLNWTELNEAVYFGGFKAVIVWVGNKNAAFLFLIFAAHLQYHMETGAETRTELNVFFMFVEKCCHDALHCYVDQLIRFWSVLNVIQK